MAGPRGVLSYNEREPPAGRFLMEPSPSFASAPELPQKAVLDELRALDGLVVRERVELRQLTRFGIGGAADLLAETADPEVFARVAGVCQAHGYPVYVMGDGSNVIVSDDGFRGLILRFVARGLSRDGDNVTADAGAPLQSLVDFAIDAGLRGLETLAGIPGSAGAAVYGNAGAYGHSISERVAWVQLFDGGGVRTFGNAACEFDYRESAFKRHKQWVIFRAGLALEPADAGELRKTASEIMAVRDKKFPPAMRCAGSIFKNLHLKNLPPAVAAAVPTQVVREGKVASAYFLEQVGAKGMRRGGIEIASYHANLIYNTGGGTAADLRAMILELKKRVREKYGFEVEEEVQYVGEF
jgi:UDP-N-acetylmuramate dehydrogenase